MEKIYILGKLGGSDGFQVYDLKSKATAQGDDALFFDTFHKDGRKELFEIRRVKYKTYHTYIKYDLSAKRPGCMLGFSFVYEENGNVIKDFLGLRQKMKAALNHLLEENGEIKIASFNDKKVIESLNHIEKFTKEEVKADRLPLPLNPVQYSPHNPKDLTNEQIWEMLKKSNYVEISEEIPTALSQKEQTIKTLTSQIQQLKSLNQQKDTEISNLKNEKDTLRKENEKLETQLTNANSNNSVRDRKIRNALKEIESCLSTNEEIPPTPHPQKESKLKEVLPFFILILVIINIVIGVSNCSGNSKQDETKHKDKIEELKNEIQQYKDSCDLLNTQINNITNELNNTIEVYKEDTKPKHKKEEVKKEQKDTNKKQPSQDEKDYDEWVENADNKKNMTQILKNEAGIRRKKYENINKDCKDCKEFTKEEKINLWKKYFKKQVN